MWEAKLKVKRNTFQLNYSSFFNFSIMLHIVANLEQVPVIFEQDKSRQR